MIDPRQTLFAYQCLAASSAVAAAAHLISLSAAILFATGLIIGTVNVAVFGRRG